MVMVTFIRNKMTMKHFKGSDRESTAIEYSASFQNAVINNDNFAYMLRIFKAGDRGNEKGRRAYLSPILPLGITQ